MKISKIKMFTMISCIIISISLITANALAYVNYRYNPVTAQTQETSSWCWAACGSMAAKYLGATGATQTKFVESVFGVPADPNQGGTVADIQTGLSKFNITSSIVVNSLSFGTIIYNIDRNMNMIAGIFWTSGNGGHALLIRGYYQDTDNDTQNVYYVDPANGSYNIRSYSSFVSNSSWNWSNSLNSIYV